MKIKNVSDKILSSKKKNLKSAEKQASYGPEKVSRHRNNPPPPHAPSPHLVDHMEHHAYP